ncbi:MAG: DUF6880 family protein [Sulfitobacter sp.]
MSKKTLNAENLAALGAENLANLLIEVSTGSAEIKRRLRLELSHNLGPAELARDVRKRLTSIRRSTSFVGWRRRKSLIKDLQTQADMITNKIAPDAPDTAFDLLWVFIELAPSVYERVDDSRGDVGDVFRDARASLELIAPRAGLEPQALAVRMWNALRDNRYGAFDGIIGLLAATLGETGLEHLKMLIEVHAETPVDEPEGHAAIQFLRDLRSNSGNYAAEQKSRLIKQCLQEIAIVQGDTGAYVAQYMAAELARPHIAAEVAELELSEGRAEEAMAVLTGADLDQRRDDDLRWDAAYVTCLLALDRLDEAQAHRWTCFCATLGAGFLREYLKVLPDFDDIEVEDEAKTHALQFHDMNTALIFFLEWPDLIFAAKLVEDRAEELDGNDYHLLTPAAEALRDRHPRAAVVLWRVMIDHALAERRNTRYGHAADHLMDCVAADMELTDYGRFPSHDVFEGYLREQHKHKSSFWARLP